MDDYVAAITAQTKPLKSARTADNRYNVELLQEKARGLFKGSAGQKDIGRYLIICLTLRYHTVLGMQQ